MLEKLTKMDGLGSSSGFLLVFLIYSAGSQRAGFFPCPLSCFSGSFCPDFALGLGLSVVLQEGQRILEEILRAGLAELGLDCDEQALDRFRRYYEILEEQNKVMNLTAIRDPAQAARLHIVDALELLRTGDLRGKTVLDVGTGGGIPGVVLKLAQPELHLTLLDATAKKLDWLRQLLPALGVSAEFILGRAEEAIIDHREQYDVATARAVSRLNALCELCLPYVKVGGLFLAMKGPEADQELAEAKEAIRTLGAKARPLHRYQLPVTEDGGGEQRTVVVLEKTAPTPAQYPRRWAKIKDTPL